MNPKDRVTLIAMTVLLTLVVDHSLFHFLLSSSPTPGAESIFNGATPQVQSIQHFADFDSFQDAAVEQQQQQHQQGQQQQQQQQQQQVAQADEQLPQVSHVPYSYTEMESDSCPKGTVKDALGECVSFSRDQLIVAAEREASINGSLCQCPEFPCDCPSHHACGSFHHSYADRIRPNHHDVNSAFVTAERSQSVKETTRRPILIYIYEIERCTNEYYSNCTGNKQFHTQYQFPKLTKASSFHVTKDPEKADYFFTPCANKCIASRLHRNFTAITEFYDAVIRELRFDYPYFNRTGGRDHVFIWASGSGPATYLNWKKNLPHSIFLSPEASWTRHWAHVAPYYDPFKDIVVPGLLSPEKQLEIRKLKKPILERTSVVSYHGDLSKSFSREALRHMAQFFDDGHDPRFLIGKKRNRQEYLEALTNSRFCLVPEGYSSWTIRFYEAVVGGCVPVILSDKIRLPFEEEIDYTRLSIKWPEVSINQHLLHYLSSIDDQQLLAYSKYMESVEPLLMWPGEEHFLTHEGIGGAWGMIMRELERKSKVTKNSDNTFWTEPGHPFYHANYFENMPNHTYHIPKASKYQKKRDAKAKAAAEAAAAEAAAAGENGSEGAFTGVEGEDVGGTSGDDGDVTGRVRLRDEHWTEEREHLIRTHRGHDSESGGGETH